jgi:zinc protease
MRANRRTTVLSVAGATGVAALLAAGTPPPVSAQPSEPPRTIELREADSPFIAFNVWIRSGAASDPQGKEGLASLTAAVIAGGATTHATVEQILQKLYPLAASYGAQVDKEMTVFTGRVHRDNLEVYYDLFRNALLSPAFSEGDFARIKAQRLNLLERGRRYSRDEELSKQLLYWMAYEGTPYQHPEEGYVSSVRSITLDDVKGYYREHYRRDNVVAGIGGGYPAGFAGRLRQDLDTLPQGAPRRVEAPAPRAPSGVKVLLVEKQTDASAISIGYPIGLLRHQDDFVPLTIANSHLGEHRNAVGRLQQAIRETRWMNYGNYSYIEAFPAGYATQQPRVNVARRSHLFEIWIRPISMTAPGNLHERTLFATRAALFELKKLVNQGLSREQVEASKQFLRNYAATWGTTISRRLGYAIDDAFYGIRPPGFLRSFRAAVDAATAEQVNAAIRRHLQDDNYYLVIITADAGALKQKLLGGAATSITYAGERAPALLAEDKTIAGLPIEVREADISILPIDKVFE